MAKRLATQAATGAEPDTSARSNGVTSKRPPRQQSPGARTAALQAERERYLPRGVFTYHPSFPRRVRVRALPT